MDYVWNCVYLAMLLAIVLGTSWMHYKTTDSLVEKLTVKNSELTNKLTEENDKWRTQYRNMYDQLMNLKMSQSDNYNTHMNFKYQEMLTGNQDTEPPENGEPEEVIPETVQEYTMRMVAEHGIEVMSQRWYKEEIANFETTMES